MLCSAQAHSFHVVMCLRNLPSLSSLRGFEVAPWLLRASLWALAEITWEMHCGDYTPLSTHSPALQSWQGFLSFSNRANMCSASPCSQIKFWTIPRWSSGLKTLRKLDSRSKKIQFSVRNSEKFMQFSENKFTSIVIFFICDCVQSMRIMQLFVIRELSINYNSWFLLNKRLWLWNNFSVLQY